jgi:hypothetical protein
MIHGLSVYFLAKQDELQQATCKFILYSVAIFKDFGMVVRPIHYKDFSPIQRRRKQFYQIVMRDFTNSTNKFHNYSSISL